MVRYAHRYRDEQTTRDGMSKRLANLSSPLTTCNGRDHLRALALALALVGAPPGRDDMSNH
ncbi:hypothetical protein O9K51_07900 [Purpureocillium lavendulum]|uniref:Uncharacterized protein n=1 Tax=Purpureocillium lavendulum TaxID=1247861 RepID=A0AB34FLQ9_9HYPO|nr:hypothetical protein O9K51_07900 [Purpureocillium lavendulum]